MTVLSASSVTWRGLTFVGSRGDGSRPWFDTIEGWEELPDTRRDSTPRPGNHGSFDSAVWSDERVVVLSGACMSATDRDAQLMALSSVMTLGGSGPEDLTVTHAGRTLTAGARLKRFKAPPGRDWASGRFTWAVEWACPDPLRYSNPVTQTTGFPVQSGGLEYDLYTDGAGVDTGFLEYGIAGASGRVTITNLGNADAWITYTMTGPVPAEGFEVAVVGTGQLHRFQGGIPANSSILVDTATGAETILMDGVSDRSGQMTRMDPFYVPANSSIELAVTNLGTFTSAVAAFTIRSGSW